MPRVRLTVEPVPTWLDAACWLGHAELGSEPIDDAHVRITLELSSADAADVAARLRGLGLDGRPLRVETMPPLGRTLVREARLREARARRDTTPGFLRPGARATGEGRFSLTPEALALSLGQLAKGASIVDACCGSGGNAIGFARAGCQVTAIELDSARLDEARHNAAVYGVQEQIRFMRADALEAVAQLGADLLFVDPPWGEQYDKRACELSDFPLLSALLAADLRGYRELWLKLPGSFRVASIERARASAWLGRAPGDRTRIKFILLRVPGVTGP